jgi:hypothetical protein
MKCYKICGNYLTRSNGESELLLAKEMRAASREREWGKMVTIFISILEYSFCLAQNYENVRVPFLTRN